MIELIYTLRSGGTQKKLVNPTSISEVEEDPRKDVQSRTIVKMANGDKFYCTNTYEQLQAQFNK